MRGARVIPEPPRAQPASDSHLTFLREFLLLENEELGGWCIGISRSSPVDSCVAWLSLFARVLFSFFSSGVSESHASWNVRTYDYKAGILGDSHEEYVFSFCFLLFMCFAFYLKIAF